MDIRTLDVQRYPGQRIRVHGWLHQVRRLGGVAFVLLRDGYGIIQAVVEQAEDLTSLEGLANGSVLAIEGVVVPRSDGAQVELHQPTIKVITPVVEPPPVALHRRELTLTVPVLLDNAVVANRHPQRQALLRLAAGVMAGFRAVLDERGFTEIQSPKLVAAATEGGANVFGVRYFDRSAFLAQSPQFYKQIMVGVFERVYEVGPVFRAEPHDTTRHINEYVSLDVEFGFIEDHWTVMSLVEETLRGIMSHLSAHYAGELAQLGCSVPAVPLRIPHIHFEEAQTLIWERHGVDVRGEPDLSPQDERYLGEWAQARHGSDFLFVSGYPMSKRPFYTHPAPHRPGYSNSFDLLYRGTELITGGQRLHRYADYLAALEERGLAPEPFAAYLQTFRYGMPPHGGFAIGLERFLMQLVGAPNIKLVTLFPRDQQRLAP